MNETEMGAVSERSAGKAEERMKRGRKGRPDSERGGRGSKGGGGGGKMHTDAVKKVVVVRARAVHEAAPRFLL